MINYKRKLIFFYFNNTKLKEKKKTRQPCTHRYSTSS